MVGYSSLFPSICQQILLRVIYMSILCTFTSDFMSVPVKLVNYFRYKNTFRVRVHYIFSARSLV